MNIYKIFFIGDEGEDNSGLVAETSEEDAVNAFCEHFEIDSGDYELEVTLLVENVKKGSVFGDEWGMN